MGLGIVEEVWWRRIGWWNVDAEEVDGLIFLGVQCVFILVTVCERSRFFDRVEWRIPVSMVSIWRCVFSDSVVVLPTDLLRVPNSACLRALSGLH